MKKRIVLFLIPAAIMTIIIAVGIGIKMLGGSAKKNTFTIPAETNAVFSSPTSNHLILLIKGNINVLTDDGKITEYPTDYEVEYVSFNNDEALLIDSKSNLYRYSFKNKESFGPLLGNVCHCDISLNSYAAVTKDGELYVYGDNHYAQLGIKEEYATEFRKIEYLNDVKAVDLNGDISVALTAQGEVYQCGLIYYDKEKKPVVFSEFKRIKELSNVTKVYSHMGNIAVKVSGDVVYWNRKLNMDTEESMQFPDNINISDFCSQNDMTDYSPGGVFNACIDSKGAVYLWGEDITEKKSLAKTTIDLPTQIYQSERIDSIYSGYNVIYLKIQDKLLLLRRE